MLRGGIKDRFGEAAETSARAACAPQSVTSVNGADGIGDAEGKAARVAASSRGKLASFKSGVLSLLISVDVGCFCA
jgi:hypothetical protein